MAGAERKIQIKGFGAFYYPGTGILKVVMPKDMPFEEEEAKEIFTRIMELCEGGARNGLLLDIREVTSRGPSKKFRRWMREKTDEIGFTRTAVIVTSPVGRMFAKIISSTTGQSKQTYFFKTEEDAYNWLKENNEERSLD